MPGTMDDMFATLKAWSEPQIGDEQFSATLWVRWTDDEPLGDDEFITDGEPAESTPHMNSLRECLAEFFDLVVGEGMGDDNVAEMMGNVIGSVYEDRGDGPKWYLSGRQWDIGYDPTDGWWTQARDDDLRYWAGVAANAIAKRDALVRDSSGVPIGIANVSGLSVDEVERIRA